MRKQTMIVALGMALSMGSASVAVAQGAQQPAQHEGRGAWQGRGPGGREGRGPGGMLLEGIALTDAQKAKLQELRKQDQGKGGDREQFRATMEEARALRQKGDTAGARAKMEPVRAQMQAQRDREVASIRAILTPAQQTQFDANVAEMKQRQAKGGEHGERGGRGGRGHDGQHGKPQQGR